MHEKTDYVVGRGKPPVHSRFKKGQSGNPGGRPGAAKTFQRRFREAVEAALQRDVVSLELADPDTSLEAMAIQLVLEAAQGNSHARRQLLQVTEGFAAEDREAENAGDHGAAATTGGALGAEPQATTFSEGKTQGRFEGEAPLHREREAKQEVGARDTNGSGNSSGKPEPPSVIHAKRPTIIIAGEVVQQGD